jgi:hypothetical protein
MLDVGIIAPPTKRAAINCFLHRRQKGGACPGASRLGSGRPGCGRQLGRASRGRSRLAPGFSDQSELVLCRLRPACLRAKAELRGHLRLATMASSPLSNFETLLEYDPEKWTVFPRDFSGRRLRGDHAQTRRSTSMIQLS